MLLELLHTWLNEPHIAERWDGSVSIKEVRKQYFRQNDNLEPYIVYLNDNPIGYVQSYWTSRCRSGWWEDEKDPGTIGIDYFIGQVQRLDQGIGTEMIKQFAQMLFCNSEVTRIISDPNPNNPRSVRCLEKAGFTKIKDIQTPDGPSVMMELTRVAH